MRSAALKKMMLISVSSLFFLVVFVIGMLHYSQLVLKQEFPVESIIFNNQHNLTMERYQLIENNLEKNQSFVILDGDGRLLFQTKRYEIETEMYRKEYLTSANEERILEFRYPKKNTAGYLSRLTQLNILYVVTFFVITLLVLFSAVFIIRMIQAEQVADKEAYEKETRRMLSCIAHDVKNALTVIEGYAVMIQSKTLKEDEECKVITAISDKAKVCAENMNTLFDFVNLDHPEYKLHKESIDVYEFINRFLLEHYSEITLNQYEVQLLDVDSSISVSVDVKELKRVFINILQNTFVHANGSHIFIRVVKIGANCKIYFGDDGKGVQPSVIPHLFAPFMTENDEDIAGKGTGLGLALSRKIMRLHNGDLTLEMEKNAPVKQWFVCTLPID